MKKRNKIVTENKGNLEPANETDKAIDNDTLQADTAAQVTAENSEKPTQTAAPDTPKDSDNDTAKAPVEKTSTAPVKKPKTPANTAKDTPTTREKEATTTRPTDKMPKPQTSKNDTAAKKSAAENPPASKSGKLALAISVVALALVGFQYYQQMHTQGSNAQIEGKIAELKQALDSGISQSQATANSVKSEAQASVAKANAAIDSVNANLAELKQAESQKSNDIEGLQARLTRSIQQVEASGLEQNSRKDWLLAEVEYLLRLANQRVLMENTPIGALALLQSADKILKQTDDVSIFSVRKSLAADIAALSAVTPIDQEGLYLKIDALSAQINQLKLVPITDKKHLPKIIDEVAIDAANEAQQSSFSKIWDSASAKLSTLVVVNNRDASIEPLLSPAQQAGLLQNLHILFEQAQLALLQRKQVPYLRSIEKAEQIINTHFQQKDSVSQALLSGLSALKEETVSVDLPSIAGSLNELKAYLKQAAEIKSGAQN